MKKCSSLEKLDAFQILVHTHDHVWFDRSFSFAIRKEVCETLWFFAVSCHLEEVTKSVESR